MLHFIAIFFPISLILYGITKILIQLVVMLMSIKFESKLNLPHLLLNDLPI